MGQFTFRRSDRLTEASQFREVRAKGEKTTLSPLVVYRKKNSVGHPRLGVALSKKAAPSVRRNWVKRRVRELFRQNKLALGGYDYFFYSTRDVTSLTKSEWKRISDRFLKWCEQRG